MIRATVVTRGGHRVRAHIRNASRKGPKGLEVGFFEESKYPDGTYVANVAAYNNYGTDNIPARPFLDQFSDESPDLLRDYSAITPPVTDAVLTQMGSELQRGLQSTIREWTEPPNAQSTVDKKGFNDPLIDTELMVNSVKFRIED